MKKIIMYVLMLSVYGCKAALSVARQTVKFAAQVRSIAHGPTVVRLDQNLNVLDRRWFALQGAIALYNGTITQALESEATKKVTSRLFNQHPGEPIRFTVAPGNPAIALNAELICELIALRRQGEIKVDVFVESETFKKWREAYGFNKKTFRPEVRRLIKELNEINEEKAAQLLGAAWYYKSQLEEPLLERLKTAGLALKDERELEKEDFSGREKLLVKLLESRNAGDVSALMPEEITGFRNRCAEKSLWAIMNLLLYNHETKKLDLSLLPLSLQATCNSRFVTFIQNYSTPSTSGYYEKAHKDFLNMVEDLPFIKYEVEGKGAPVFPSAVEIGKLLQYFFGTQAATCKEICKELQVSGSNRTVECIQDTEGIVKFSVKYKDNPSENLSGTLSYNSKHAFFAFDSKETFSSADLTRLVILEREEAQKPGTYVKVMPGYLHKIRDWESTSVDDLIRVMKEYSLKTADLTELSPGLHFYKDSLVHTVVITGNTKVLHALLKMGCKTFLKNSKGYSPVDCAREAFITLADEDPKKLNIFWCLNILELHRYKEKIQDFFSKVGNALLFNSGRY